MFNNGPDSNTARVRVIGFLPLFGGVVKLSRVTGMVKNIIRDDGHSFSLFIEHCPDEVLKCEQRSLKLVDSCIFNGPTLVIRYPLPLSNTYYMYTHSEYINIWRTVVIEIPTVPYTCWWIFGHTTRVTNNTCILTWRQVVKNLPCTTNVHTRQSHGIMIIVFQRNSKSFRKMRAKYFGFAIRILSLPVVEKRPILNRLLIIWNLCEILCYSQTKWIQIMQWFQRESG